MIKNRKILIVGAAGSIGSELVRQLGKENQVTCFDFNETGLFDLIEELKFKNYSVEGVIGNIRNKETVEDVFWRFRPEIIFHAAALKHVSPAETIPMEYVETNINGTYNLMRASEKYRAEKFIFISTDKVVNAENI